MIDIFFDTRPTPKSRPRLGKGRVYTPEKTLNAEKEIKLLLKSHMNKNAISMTDKPVCVSMKFNYYYPKKTTKAQSVIKELGMLYKVSRPDLDNLAKLVLDAMNNLVYVDDSQVCKMIIEKKYADVEGIELQVFRL